MSHPDDRSGNMADKPRPASRSDTPDLKALDAKATPGKWGQAEDLAEDQNEGTKACDALIVAVNALLSRGQQDNAVEQGNVQNDTVTLEGSAPAATPAAQEETPIASDGQGAVTDISASLPPASAGILQVLPMPEQPPTVTTSTHDAAAPSDTLETDALRRVHQPKYADLGMVASLLREYDESHERIERRCRAEVRRAGVEDDDAGGPDHYGAQHPEPR